MVLMGAQRRWNNSQYSVILGPCPGCDNWQVDYADDIATSYVEVRVNPEGRIEPDPTPWFLALEGVLQEHLAECEPLRQIVAAGASEST